MDGMTMTTSSSAAATSSPSMSSSTSSMTMDMIFYTSTSTPLYSRSWTPSTTTAYAFTCIFLAVLAVALRCLYALKHILEAKWTHKALRRQYVLVPDADPRLLQPDSNWDGDQKEDMQGRTTTAVLTTRGVDEKVKLIERGPVFGATWVKPWRLSVDLPRACLVTVMVGIAYLEMLAVMTMNVGYFMSVLAGAFVGELFVGRYSQHVDQHH